MNVLLMAPSVREGLLSGLDDGMPKKVARAFGVYPHLGICYLAAHLRRHGHQVSIIDLNVEPLGRQGLLERVADIAPDLVGVSCMSFTFLGALDAARVIKEGLGLPVVLGGPHAHLYPEELLGHSFVDLVVTGEGEQTLLELVAALEQPAGPRREQRLGAVLGLGYKPADGGPPRVNPPRPLIADLDSLAPPAVDLIPMERYYGCNLATPHMTVITTRGCPYACSFCSRAPWGKTMRANSARRVADEVEALVRGRGVRAIDFFDDTFIFNRPRIHELAELLAERGLEFEFGINTRVNNVDRPVLRTLKKMGCRTIAFGVESGDPAVLAAMDKRITVEQIQRAFRMAKQEGLNTVGFFLVGHPDEGDAEIRNTVRLIRRLDADYFIANVVVPYPGSRLHDELLASGALGGDYWREITRDGVARPTPLANTRLTRRRLIAWRNRINRMPYLRLRSNLLKLRKVRSIHDVIRPLHTLTTSLLDREL